MPIGADSEKGHVEVGNLGAFGRRGRKLCAVEHGCRIEIVDRVGRGTPVDVLRAQRNVIEQRRPGLGVVPFGVASRQPPLVAPPQDDARPVDAVSCGRRVDRLEHADSHSAAGEYDVDLGLLVEQVHHLRDEPRRDRAGQGLFVGMHEHPAGVAHFFDSSNAVELIFEGASSCESPFWITSPNRSSGSRRRSSSARQSRRLRRGSEMAWTG